MNLLRGLGQIPCPLCNKQQQCNSQNSRPTFAKSEWQPIGASAVSTYFLNYCYN